MKLEDYELIQDFLRNELSQEKKVEVLERLKTDLPFRNAFQEEQQQFDAFDEASWSFINDDNSEEINSYESLFKSEKTQQLRTSIKEAAAQYERKTNGPNKYWIFYSVAAMLAVCFTLYSVFSTTTSPEKLYASNFDASELPGLTVRGSNVDSLLIRAEALYNNKEYAQAIPLLDQSIAAQPKNVSTLFLYKGVAHMELGEANKAESTFNSLIESDFLDAQKGYWYKALLYLKTNQLEQAKTTLQEITTNNYYHKEKAATLLKALK